jgi:hypothetical protein
MLYFHECPRWNVQCAFNPFVATKLTVTDLYYIVHNFLITYKRLKSKLFVVHDWYSKLCSVPYSTQIINSIRLCMYDHLEQIDSLQLLQYLYSVIITGKIRPKLLLQLLLSIATVYTIYARRSQSCLTLTESTTLMLITRIQQLHFCYVLNCIG